MSYIYFTSESVTPGHPDKICDQISDAFVDAALKEDKNSKMAVEASIKDNFIFVFGEANTKANLDYEKIAQRVLKEIGYDENFEVLCKVEQQSSEIANAVEDNSTTLAGDQGIMFGYATNETDNFMPLPIDLAHKLAKRLSTLRDEIKWLKPDGKTQVTVAYDKNMKPKFVHTILISASHDEEIGHSEIERTIIEKVIKKVIPNNLLTDSTKFIINPSGAFSIAGPFSDSGTTGRKIVVDSYGGFGRIGGGCFSSKDPSKVDRSAAYYARYVAKSIVAAGLCERLELQLSYAIGLSQPLSIHIDTFHTENISKTEILSIIKNNFDFSVQNIIDELDLLKPIYQKTSNYGHFGRDEFSWEQIKHLQIKKSV